MNEAPIPTVLVVAVALVDVDGRVLIARRPEGKQLAGLWEFPGGKVEPGERHRQDPRGEQAGARQGEAGGAPLEITIGAQGWLDAAVAAGRRGQEISVAF